MELSSTDRLHPPSPVAKIRTTSNEIVVRFRMSIPRGPGESPLMQPHSAYSQAGILVM